MFVWASIGLLALSLLAALLATAWFGLTRALRPPRWTAPYSPSDYGWRTESVRFPSRDGLTIAGWFIAGSRREAVILIHGYGANKGDLLPHALYLHDAGYNLLLIDLRSCGESAGKIVTAGAKEPLDVLGAIDYLKTRPEVDGDRIGLQGISLGGAVAILAAAQAPEVGGVIVEGTFKDLRDVLTTGFTQFTGLPAFVFRPLVAILGWLRVGARVGDVSPVQALARLHRPVLIIHGVADELIPVHNAHALYAAATEPKELWLLDAVGHAQAFVERPEEFRQRVLAFWERVFTSKQVVPPGRALQVSTPWRSG